ncbi:MAG: hypothetical protein ACJAVM_000849 [Sulfitobacter sp.]|jgi:hypothetical protein
MEWHIAVACGGGKRGDVGSGGYCVGMDCWRFVLPVKVAEWNQI